MPAPIPENIEESIVRQLVQKKSYKDIVAHVNNKFERKINVQTVGRIRNRNLERIINARELVVKNAAIEAIDIQQRAYRLIDKKLERAEIQDDEMEKIRKKYRDGTISRAEYLLQIESYEQVTLSQISQVLGAVKDDKKQAGAEMTPADTAALQLMVEGIKSGNPINLVQILRQTSEQSPEA